MANKMLLGSFTHTHTQSVSSPFVNSKAPPKWVENVREKISFLHNAQTITLFNTATANGTQQKKEQEEAVQQHATTLRYELSNE
jgi:hypothetical protein